MSGDQNITLALQEGFHDDTVLITVDGKSPERLEHVSTRTQIGLARELNLSVPAGARLTIALPDHGLAQTVDLGTGENAHYGVSVDRQAGHVAVRRSSTPFGYL